jgi:OmpA-OmpF porin, OOP family
MKFRGIIQFVALALLSGAAAAQSITNDGYARDMSSDVVKSAFGLCWHSGQWTESKAIAECDPDAAPKPVRVEARPTAPAFEPKVVEAPSPAPAPAPIVAAPIPTAVALPARARQAITLGADASFDTGKADLKSEGQAKLDQLVAKLREVSFDSITVTGHTDNVGGDAANQKLSLRRANAVKQYLASHGIDAQKVKTSGRGKTSPVANNKTAQGRAKNRRVEVVITGTRSS